MDTEIIRIETCPHCGKIQYYGHTRRCLTENIFMEGEPCDPECGPLPCECQENTSQP